MSEKDPYVEMYRLNLLAGAYDYLTELRTQDVASNKRRTLLVESVLLALGTGNEGIQRMAITTMVLCAELHRTDTADLFNLLENNIKPDRPDFLTHPTAS